MRYSFILFIALAVPVTAHPATLHVPGTYTKIQDAIDAAVKGDTVLVASGTYVENIDFRGKAITVTSSSGPDTTIIDGGAPPNPDHGSTVTFQSGEQSGSVLEGFTITNGSGNWEYIFSPGVWMGHGGGIYCTNSSSPLITLNIIMSNKVWRPSASIYSYGGGICCEDNSSPDIFSNTINKNEANMGCGIYCGGYSSPSIVNNTIDHNAGMSPSYGGGIGCSGHCDPLIMNNIITHNSVDYYGGGIRCYESSPMIVENVISNNSAYGTWYATGGGIFCTTGSSPVIERNIITKNLTQLHGGGIHTSQGSPEITGNIIAENEVIGDPAACPVSGGGGISCLIASPKISNNVIFDNLAKGITIGYGGGIYFDKSSLSMANNCIYGNTSSHFGGAIQCVDGTLIVRNSILWNNIAPTGREVSIGDTLGSAVFDIGHSDVDGGQASVYVEQGSTLLWGSGMINKNPLFVDSSSGDFHLTHSSPCKDTGDNSAVIDPTDFEGDPRIAYGLVDMGADEFYTHLYWTGDAAPGGTVAFKFVGLPGTAPVQLWLGSGVLEPPWHTKYGDWYLQFPLLGSIPNLGSIPSPDGVLVFPFTFPANIPTPLILPFQSGIGMDLTNLSVMEVK